MNRGAQGGVLNNNKYVPPNAAGYNGGGYRANTP